MIWGCVAHGASGYVAVHSMRVHHMRLRSSYDCVAHAAAWLMQPHCMWVDIVVRTYAGSLSNHGRDRVS